MSETCEQCSTTGACPFAYTEESEMVQNLGCLPMPLEIVDMRLSHGKTWACHSNPEKPCLGALNFMRERGLEYKVIDPELVTEKSNWGDFISPDLRPTVEKVKAGTEQMLKERYG